MVNGPNLNWLGKREPKIYGTQSWAAIWGALEKWGRRNEVDLDYFQSNHEGALIDYLQDASGRAAGIVFNPAALAHTSIALRDCVAMLPVPLVEVHLTPIQKREIFRHHSHVADAAAATISGFGPDGYFLSLALLKHLLQLSSPVRGP
ncbi:MAG: 3-dehydroquinate dehydratase [Deltaproteobacteria bacterium]|nr:3-dehydroquinate dehydratase [Deltaproteobacteria bacterium]